MGEAKPRSLAISLAAQRAAMELPPVPVLRFGQAARVPRGTRITGPAGRSPCFTWNIRKSDSCRWSGSADGRGTFGVFAPRSRTPRDGPFQINGTRRRVATHGASRAIPPRRSSRAHRRLSAGVFHPARNDPEPPMCGDCVDSADGARSRVAHNRSSEPADRQQQDGTVHQRQRTHPSTPSTGPAAVLRQPPQPTPCAPPATQPGLAGSLATVRHPDQARPAQPAERA
jgi:hypothetical protein